MCPLPAYQQTGQQPEGCKFERKDEVHFGSLHSMRLLSKQVAKSREWMYGYPKREASALVAQRAVQLAELAAKLAPH